MTYTIGKGHSQPDDLSGKVKPGDVLQFVRGDTGTTTHGINLATNVRVLDIGDKSKPVYLCNVIPKGASFLAVGKGVSDVDIRGVGATSSAGGNGDGSVVNISGIRVHVSDIHAHGNLRVFSCMSSEDVNIDNWTADTKAEYIGYIGGRTGLVETSPDPLRTTIRNGKAKLASPGLKGIRASREAGILIEDVSIDGTGNAMARCAFDQKTPGDIALRRCHSIGFPTAFSTGPLAQGDGMGMSDWKTVRTIHTLIEDCTATGARQAILVEPGVLRVDVVRGSFEFSQAGITVNGPYGGWDKAMNKPANLINPLRPASPVTVTKTTVFKGAKRFAGVTSLVTEV